MAVEIYKQDPSIQLETREMQTEPLQRDLRVLLERIICLINFNYEFRCFAFYLLKIGV